MLSSGMFFPLSKVSLLFLCVSLENNIVLRGETSKGLDSVLMEDYSQADTDYPTHEHQNQDLQLKAELGTHCIQSVCQISTLNYMYIV